MGGKLRAHLSLQSSLVWVLEETGYGFHSSGITVAVLRRMVQGITYEQGKMNFPFTSSPNNKINQLDYSVMKCSAL